MTRAVLITQCLQRDFVGPVGPHEPLPNALHVGRAEAVRVLGVDPAVGPLAQLMHWAREQPADDLQIVHIRDWHDDADPAQRAHLARFGRHCIAGTPGAELVLGLDAAVTERPSEQFVDALTLNDFEGTRLREVLDDLRAGAEADDLRIAVVGVWTEAKVTFLLYELMTRCGFPRLATCSALTASASRSQHFNALEQLRKVLGVHVCDSVGELAEWLVPGGEGLVHSPALPEQSMRPRVEVDAGGAPPEGHDLDLIGLLYRDSARLVLDPLGGGFSGAAVYRARSFDALGHELAPTVLKVGPRDLIADERVAFERVEGILGNDAPSVRGFADLGGRAGIKYAYAAMGRGDVATFKSLYEDGLSLPRVRAILSRVFEDILARFHAVAAYERLPLLEAYGFQPYYADGMRARADAIMGAPQGARIRFPGGVELDHVADFYADALDGLKARRAGGEFHYVAYLHGDLNGANILLDARDNVWLIDFAHAQRGHVLQDLAKLENDLLFIFTAIDGDDELAQAIRLTSALRAVQDLAQPLPEAPPDGVELPSLVRAWAVVRELRRIGGALVREDRDPTQLAIALLRYSAHTMTFDESSPWQKRWALAASCAHAEDIRRADRDNRRLRVDWLREGTLGAAPGRLGLTLCPGRKDRGRDLDEDLAAIVDQGGRRVLSLLSDPELEWADVVALPEACARLGLQHRHEAIVDQGVPTDALMDDLVDWVLGALDAGEDVVLHCMGGLGRSGIVAACALVLRGHTSGEAISIVREARGPRAVETALQARFVAEWAARRR